MSDSPEKQFDLLEVARLLVLKAGLTEGYWQLNVVFRFGGGTMGPTPDEARPTAFASVMSLGLVRVKEIGPLTVDAAALETEGVARAPSFVKFESLMEAVADDRREHRKVTGAAKAAKGKSTKGGLAAGRTARGTRAKSGGPKSGGR